MMGENRPTEKMTALPRPKRVTKTVRLHDRYELRSELGVGGMATVHLALDLLLERLVAVKIMDARFADDVEHVQRFHREAVILASLESRYVVPVYDIVTSGAAPFLVMRFVDGRTLYQELADHTRMDPHRAVHTVQEMLRGLMVLHERRLLHRDLKPSNVMRQPDGQIVLLDLGVARDLRRHMLTRPGTILGTPEYMSPEAKTGIEPVDERSDIYQAGLILGHLLVGTNEPSDARDLARCPPALAAVAARATGHIDRRYRSVREMIDALTDGVRRL